MTVATITRFDAATFLGKLLEPGAEPGPPGQPAILAGPYIETARGYLAPKDLPEPWRELYEERAAIREYDGGQAREHAEAEALREILAMMRDSAY